MIKKVKEDTITEGSPVDPKTEREIVLDFIGEKPKQEKAPVVIGNDLLKTEEDGGENFAGKKNIIKKKVVKKKKTTGKVCKNVCHTIAFSLISFFVFYSFFAFLVIGFRVDNKICRSLENIFPVPALVSGDMFIGYYQYQDGLENGLLKDLLAKKEAGLIDGKIWSFVD